MTAIYIRRANAIIWHRLSVVGAEHNTTACLDKIHVRELVSLTAAIPPSRKRCPACERDAEIKRARVATVELRPRVRDRGVAEVEVESKEGT